MRSPKQSHHNGEGGASQDEKFTDRCGTTFNGSLAKVLNP